MKKIFALLLTCCFLFAVAAPTVYPTSERVRLYVRQRADQTTQFLTEEELLAELSEAPYSGVYSQEISKDGAVQITVSITPCAKPTASAGPADIWYQVEVWVQFLKMPTYRMTDAVSVTLQNFSWATTHDDNYFSALSYTTKGSDQRTTLVQHYPTLGTVGYEWNLPNNKPGKSVDSMQIYIRATGSLTYPSTQGALSATVGYTHTYSPLGLQAGFLFKSSYVTATNALFCGHNDYSLYHAVFFNR